MLFAQHYDTSFFLDDSYSFEKKINHGYYNVFPRMKMMKDGSLHTRAEQHITNVFCVINVPEVRDDGICFWDLSRNVSEETDNYKEDLTDDYFCDPGPGDHFLFNDKQGDTIRSHFGLVCDKYKNMLLFKICSALGNLFGCVVTFFISKLFGRRPGFFTASLWMVCGSVVKLIASKNFNYFIAGTFFVNMGIFGCYQLCFVYLVEIIGWRKPVFSKITCFTYNSLIGTTFLVPFYIGNIIPGLFIEVALVKFYTYIYAVSAATISIALTVFFIPESPRWLLSTYKADRAQEVLSDIAKTNKKDVDIKVELVPRDPERTKDLDGAEIREFYVLVKFNRADQEDVFMEMRSYPWGAFFTPQTCVYTIAILILWFFTSAISVDIKSYIPIGHDARIYLSRCLIEILGLVMVAGIEGFVGRRPSLLLLLLASTLALIASQLVFGAHQIIIPEVDKYGIIYRLHDILAFLGAPMKSILLWYSLDLYPTAMRETAFNLSLGFGVVAMASAEGFLPLVTKLNFDFDMKDNMTSAGGGEPFLMLAFGAILTALSCYYLPEIMNHHSIDTLDDLLYIEKTNKYLKPYERAEKVSPEKKII